MDLLRVKHLDYGLKLAVESLQGRDGDIEEWLADEELRRPKTGKESRIIEG